MSALIDAIALVESARADWDAAMQGRVFATKDYADWRRTRLDAEAAATARLEAAGAVIRRAGPVEAIKFAGIQSTSTCGLLGAIGNWLTSARRKLGEKTDG